MNKFNFKKIFVGLTSSVILSSICASNIFGMEKERLIYNSALNDIVRFKNVIDRIEEEIENIEDLDTIKTQLEKQLIMLCSGIANTVRKINDNQTSGTILRLRLDPIRSIINKMIEVVKITIDLGERKNLKFTILEKCINENKELFNQHY